MKKLSIMMLCSLFIFGLYGVFNETSVNARILPELCDPMYEPCIVGPGDGDIDPPSSDYTAPEIHVSTMPIYLNAYEDQLVLPICDVTDNVNHYLNCDFNVSGVNVNQPGIYTIYVNAHDYSGNYADDVEITVIVEYSGTYYNIIHNDDFDFNDSFTESENSVTARFGSVYQTDYCLQLGSEFEKVGENKRGDFLYELDWKLGNTMWDYTSGDKFYDYIGELFNAHYNVYEIYDKCEETTSFSKTIYLDDDFKGSAIWTRNDTVSAADKGFFTYDPQTQTSMYFNNYIETIIYADFSTINYIKNLIDTYGETEALQILEETLENPYVQYGVGLTLLVGAIIFFPELFAGATQAMTWLAGLAIIGKYTLEFAIGEAIDNWIESIFDENSMQDNIDHALAYGHGLKLTYSCVGYYSILGKPVYLETETWNPGDGISRVTDSNEFGDLDFTSSKELAE